MMGIVSHRRTFVGAVSLSLVLSGTQDLFAEASRPLEEMRGGCDNYAWDVRSELAAMDRPTTSLTAGQDRAAAAAISIGARAYEVRLIRLEQVIRLTEPHSRRQSAGHYAGLLTFTVPHDGVYRISVAGPIWLEVVSETGPVVSQSFEMQTGCPKIFKSVAFTLHAAGRYWLQLSDSLAATAKMLITRAP